MLFSGKGEEKALLGRHLKIQCCVGRDLKLHVDGAIPTCARNNYMSIRATCHILKIKMENNPY